MSKAMSKRESLVRIGTAYALAIAAGGVWLALGPDTGRLWLDGLLADLVVFAASRMHKNSSFYDAYWSVLPPLLAVYWWAAAAQSSDGGVNDVRNWLLLAVMVFWAVRLTGNWVYAFPGLHHEDFRYAPLREKAGRWEFFADLFGTHLIPTGQVFLGTLPVYVAVTAPGRDVGWLDIVAVVVGVGAVVLEWVSDTQMYRFQRTKQPGQAMDRGLWAWSRHPNYFGEFSFWVSMLLFGLAASPGDWWWISIGAVAMLAMFQGASIPMMEERSLERRPTYQDVIDRVPRFVPRPPRRAKTSQGAA